MTISVSHFGQHDGKAVDQFKLVSDTGAEVDIIGFGVAVRDWRVPVGGGLRSVVLGFDTLDAYVQHSPHFGSLAGRVANRIKTSSFDLGGKHYDLPPNAGDLHLHGGAEGLGRQVWQGVADDASNSVTFTHFSPDGAMGYPGNVNFAARYQLTGNRLRLDLSATTDQATPISLVQHQYFNLGTTDTVLDHRLQVNSSAYTPLDEGLFATGAILPSKGTQYDLRDGRTLRGAAGLPIGYDINLVLDAGRDPNQPIATIVGPDGVLTLKLWSDRPGVQVYNGLWTDIPVPGLNGKHYGQYSGLCLEDQLLPDALHNPHFPSAISTPNKPYTHWCEIEIA